MNATEFKQQIIPLNPKLIRFAWRYMQDDEAVKDIIQEIYLRLWNKRDELARVDNIEAYAIRMTKNLCLDKIKQHRTVSINDLRISGDWQDSAPVADKQTELKQEGELVKQIIQQLPEQQRLVITMRDLQYQTLDEIGLELGMNAGSVRANLSRARKKVRDELIKIRSYGYQESTTTTR
ncbi:sigma-70 family RNA polymerase sigma factor [Puteibacter caeruleilacunae]|nr:sigma-70 family RNA polymerase sigma factor [Puteibacter caeruleilacunae]